MRVLASVFEAGFTCLGQIEITVGYEEQRRLVLTLLDCYFKVLFAHSQMYAALNKNFQLPVADIGTLCSLVDDNQHMTK